MQKITVKNRHEDTQGFEENDEGYIWTGCLDIGESRVSEWNVLEMYNPPGGPWIEINTDLNQIHPALHGTVAGLRKEDGFIQIEIMHRTW